MAERTEYTGYEEWKLGRELLERVSNEQLAEQYKQLGVEFSTDARHELKGVVDDFNQFINDFNPDVDDPRILDEAMTGVYDDVDGVITGLPVGLENLAHLASDVVFERLSEEDKALLLGLRSDIDEYGVNHPRIKNVLSRASSDSARVLLNLAIEKEVIQQAFDKVERYGVDHSAVKLTLSRLSDESGLNVRNAMTSSEALYSLESAIKNKDITPDSIKDILENIPEPQQGALKDWTDASLWRQAKRDFVDGDKERAHILVDTISREKARDILRGLLMDSEEEGGASDSVPPPGDGPPGSTSGSEAKSGDAEDLSDSDRSSEQKAYEDFQERLRQEQDDQEQAYFANAHQEEAKAEERRRAEEEARRRAEEAAEEQRRKENKENEGYEGATEDERLRAENAAKGLKEKLYSFGTAYVDKSGRLKPETRRMLVLLMRKVDNARGLGDDDLDDTAVGFDLRMRADALAAKRDSYLKAEERAKVLGKDIPSDIEDLTELEAEEYEQLSSFTTFMQDVFMQDRKYNFPF